VNKTSQHKKSKEQNNGSKANADQNNSNKELPAQLKSGVEALSGVDMDGTEVHTNSSLPAQFKAHAFAQGPDIHLARGQEKHLPHEAWHVAQQKQGRVQPTKQLKGNTNINDDPSLEKEADVMGAKALKQNIDKSDRPLQKKSISGSSETSQLVIQREEAVVTEEEEDQATEEAQEIASNEGVDQTPEEEQEAATLTQKVSSAAALGNSIKGLKKGLEKTPGDVGKDLVSKSTGVMGKLGGALNIISFLGTPVKNMAMALLGVKTKWGQWGVYDKAADKGVPEAVYGLGKAMKGFAGQMASFLWNTFKLITRILFFIPAVAAVAAAIVVFQGIADAFKAVAGAVKGIWQRLKGEKKDKFSSKLLDRAIAGEPDALQLLYDLKLGSITGSDFWIVNKATILKNEVTSVDNMMSNTSEKTQSMVPGMIHDGPVDRRELIFNSPKGAPASAAELHERLVAISGSENSKNLIQDEIKATMTGYGK
jgi:hypothetical protein